MTISKRDWQRYIKRLRRINDKAADLVAAYMQRIDINSREGIKALLDYSYAVATNYGEAATELACQMYDAVAEASKVAVLPAEPASTATYGEVAKTVQGRMLHSQDAAAVGASVGRLVKMAAVDTTMKNALRDGAEWAWIPSGDTCAFCLTLASRGWTKASKDAIKNGHAEHIHDNCDCTYQIRFNKNTNVEGYDPDALYDEYINAGDTSQGRINGLRRQHYAANRDYINAQKRAAYARRAALNSVGDGGSSIARAGILEFEKSHYQDPTESGVLFTKSGERVDLGGIEHHVIGSKETIELMDGGIFTHNHPTDVTFSDNDILNGIAKGNLHEMRAITKNGNIHILLNNGADDSSRKKFLTYYSQARRKANNVANEKIRRGELQPGEKQQYINGRLEKWLAENANSYGLEYIKKRVD